MDMVLTKYMFDKLNSHGLAMDITMGVCILDNYKDSGGFLVIEFKRLVGVNYGVVMDNLIKQGLMITDGVTIVVTNKIKALKDRAEKHYDKTYDDMSLCI
ncbi:MAG: hypothetical protein ACRC0G_09520 [Fusobacteriaceae bacterium]